MSIIDNLPTTGTGVPQPTSQASARAYAAADLQLKAATALHEWAQTTRRDLDPQETNADRLQALFIGIADADQDGALDDEENEVVNMALDAGYDYLVGMGVTEDDAEALLSDWTAGVADRVHGFLVEHLPQSEEAQDMLISSFVFGLGDQEPTLDAVYKMKMAIRGGKKVRIKKRISGFVRLSSRQKLALAKAHRRSHNASAMVRRQRSMKLATKMFAHAHLRTGKLGMAAFKGH